MRRARASPGAVLLFRHRVHVDGEGDVRKPRWLSSRTSSSASAARVVYQEIVPISIPGLACEDSPVSSAAGPALRRPSHWSSVDSRVGEPNQDARSCDESLAQKAGRCRRMAIHAGGTVRRIADLDRPAVVLRGSRDRWCPHRRTLWHTSYAHPDAGGCATCRSHGLDHPGGKRRRVSCKADVFAASYEPMR